MRAALRAKRIIAAAYSVPGRRGNLCPLRYELLASGVAVLVARRRSDDVVVIRVAVRLPDGRVKQLRGESRVGIKSPREVIAYFETLYAKYGAPRG